MRSLFPVFGAIGIVLVTGLGAGQAPPPLIAPTEPRTAEEELKGLHVPPGFTVQLVAKVPKARKPANFAFDPLAGPWGPKSAKFPSPPPPAPTPPTPATITQ